MYALFSAIFFWLKSTVQTFYYTPGRDGHTTEYVPSCRCLRWRDSEVEVCVCNEENSTQPKSEKALPIKFNCEHGKLWAKSLGAVNSNNFQHMILYTFHGRHKWVEYIVCIRHIMEKH